MLPKKLRITKEKEIKRAFRTRFRHFDTFAKIYLSNNNEDRFKLLIVVSKKIAKRAHERNRIKRKIQSIFEELNNSGRLPPSISCVIQIVSKDAVHYSRNDLKENLLPKISNIYAKIISKK